MRKKLDGNEINSFETFYELTIKICHVLVLICIVLFLSYAAATLISNIILDFGTRSGI